MTDLVSLGHGNITLYLQDALEGMRVLPDKSFDLAIVDPPYGASSKAMWKLDSGHADLGFGGAWKLSSHAWDMLSGNDSFMSTIQWLTELKRLVRPTGSIWIHSTYHNSGFVNVACQLLGLEIINEVIWFKRNAFPNLAARRLTASHETILWVHTGENKREYTFNYQDVKAANFEGDSFKERGKQLRTVWDIPNNKAKEEQKFGKHPTQKPLKLVERILLISGKHHGQLLVPFLGSGTDVVAGMRYGMICTGFEIDEHYYDLACRRILHQYEQLEMMQHLEFV